MSDIAASPLLEEAKAYYKALLRPVFEGRRFVLPGNIAVGLGNVASELRGLGAARPFVVAGSRGTGSLPHRKDAEMRVLETTDNHRVCDGGRTTERTLTDTGSYDLGTDFGDLEAARNVRS